MNRRHFLMSTAVMAGGAAIRGLASPERHGPGGGRRLWRPRLQPCQRLVRHAQRGGRRAL
jgi:hypothetical protein